MDDDDKPPLRVDDRIPPRDQNLDFDPIRIQEVDPPCSNSLSLSPHSLYPTAQELPPRPPPAFECNYTHFFTLDFLKERNDQYIYKHANGLCVIGLAPTHIALDSNSSIIAVDFNVGKHSRADMKATGKRKSNARVLEPNSALCKVTTNDAFYIVRCCVKGALLEVNERLTKEPSLLKLKAATEGYIAIMMPKSDDWKKGTAAFLTSKEYADRRSSTKDSETS